MPERIAFGIHYEHTCSTKKEGKQSGTTEGDNAILTKICVTLMLISPT